MPKQNRVKNLFKSIKGSFSLAPEQSSHAQSQAQASYSSSGRDSLRHTQPIIPSSSTNRVSSQNGIPASSINRVSSQNRIPSSSTNRVSSQNDGNTICLIERNEVIVDTGKN
uniref:Uncharacterized protein n=1 Tax=Nicotiana tabacum TaxID=4097 RepID=A0A1S4D760_TOBAC|nr:PREDICTED: uncharacterized protein LOC107826721 [Nicotiana tabacum]